MKRITIISSLCLAAAIIGASASWVARGMYDEMFVMDGWYHVINTSNSELKVTIRFPSGSTKAFHLKENGFYNFVERNTGDGGLLITINGESIGYIGYVSALNSIVVLAMNEDGVIFSQIFPKLKPEQVAGSDVDG